MDLAIKLRDPKSSGDLLSNRAITSFSTFLDPDVLVKASSPITDMFNLRTVRYRTGRTQVTWEHYAAWISLPSAVYEKNLHF
jgi:hypothetical protein